MAIELKVPQVGGSDSHMLATIGSGYTEIDAQPEEGSVLDAIRNGKTRPGGRIAPIYVVILQVSAVLFDESRKSSRKIFIMLIYIKTRNG